MQILITRNGKSKRVDLPDDSHLMIAVLKIFMPSDTPVVLGKHKFFISEIDPWPPAENVKMF